MTDLDHIKKLLNDLDQNKYKRYDDKSVAKIEKELAEYGKRFASEEEPFEQYIPYPNYDDPDFYEKLFNKREFYKSRYAEHDSSKSYPEHVKEKCNPDSFRITPNQTFLKNFLSPGTPYNGLLLFHSVGTGKTCSAISIAEQFRTIFKKPVLVLMPTNLKENFRRQIFDINKVDQCTGRKYLEQVQYRSRLKPELLEKRVNRIINDNYQFMGFQEFANHVNRIEENINRIYMGTANASPSKKGKAQSDDAVAKAKFAAALRDTFSNRVIVIDEVHNVRSAKDETQKIVPPILMKVLQSAHNVKLVLLTATPMFNNAKEIVWLVNLLLANDKRPLLENKPSKPLFDVDDNLTVYGRDKFVEAIRGYVSYMRGENPFSFPLRLYPSINKDTKLLTKEAVPKRDIKNKTILKEKRLASLEIIVSEMDKFQSEIYNVAERNIISIEDDADAAEILEDDDAKGSIVQQLVQVSNITYPANKPKNEMQHFYGKAGFENCFERVSGSKNFKVNYKKEVVTKHGEFLAPDKVGKFSPKIKAILDYVANSKGIVYIFSYFIWSGLIPIAIALEHLGLAKYDDNNLLAKKPTARFPSNKNEKQACYVILAKDKMFSPNFENEIERIRSDANKDGKIIKVILGSNVSAEGIDFKCIREIHLLEPWYHLNKIEQIVGRAIRTCSHVSLPEIDRNVTIYHHAATIKDREKESIDLRIYRIAENKQSSINAIERVLRQYSIDCNLNQHALYFDPTLMKIKLKMNSSQGTSFMHALGDSTGKYKDPVQCVMQLSEPDTVDNSTFSSKFYADDLDLYSVYVRELYNSTPMMTFTDMMAQLQTKYRLIDPDVVKSVLDMMIRTKYKITNAHGVEGYLIYRGNKYLFQPSRLSDTRISTQRRLNPNFTLKRVRFDTRPEDIAEDDEDADNDDENEEELDMINVVEERFKKHCETLFNISTESADYLSLAIYGYIIDRLTIEELVKLCKQVASRWGEKGKIMKEIKLSLHEGHLIYYDPDQNISPDLYVRDPYSDKIIVIEQDGKRHSANPADMQLFNEFKKPKPYLTTEMKHKDLEGYLDLDKKDNVFKLKLIKAESNSKGTFCLSTSTIKVDFLRKEIEMISKSVLHNERKYVKENLCNIYELLLRATPKFARPYHAKVIAQNAKHIKKIEE